MVYYFYYLLLFFAWNSQVLNIVMNVFTPVTATNYNSLFSDSNFASCDVNA